MWILHINNIPTMQFFEMGSKMLNTCHHYWVYLIIQKFTAFLDILFNMTCILVSPGTGGILRMETLSFCKCPAGAFCNKLNADSHFRPHGELLKATPKILDNKGILVDAAECKWFSWLESGCGTPLMVVNGIISLLQNKRVRDEWTFCMNLWAGPGVV